MPAVKLIFEKSREGRVGWTPPEKTVDAKIRIPEKMLRQGIDLPELSEVDVVRHYTALSRMNYGVDTGFYPLGSCTMKYNPKVNEKACRMSGFCGIHPYQPTDMTQGALELMHELEKDLCEITGMKKFTLQPAAGAHGELTGIMLIKAYFMDKGEHRHKILVPDSSHGTNPASAAFCGFEVVQVNSDVDGGVDLKHLEELMTDDVAGLMLTNPNTLGLFDRNIVEIARIVHSKGGKVYYDGANMNAILGKCRPGDMGFDVIHLNLHKTFSTPHGGGGPGSGPVGASKELEAYLPKPTVEVRTEGKGRRFFLNYDRPKSIGRVRSYYGNFGVMVRAYAYIKALGGVGLRKVGENAVLNANYLMKKLKSHYYLPYDRTCMHEFVLSGRDQVHDCGVHTSDMAKRILDYGMHAPTIYFQLLVEEALMIEPTETENKDTLDEFAEVMIKIAGECRTNPELVKKAPQNTPVKRLDNTLAARNPDLRWIHR
ncbi:MAG: aminomethyl-transferring glycine dehydrogenase subunit GcvPB [Candidatus Altiarchaeota archaeon]|nr:aminomethyl-transferring glycine dehydrogenase subunit GcvPB [Candidatus Altiarchaeota archaeon]